MQRPSSVGIVPAQQGGLFKVVVNSHSIVTKRVSSARTDQLILVEVEVLQLRELPNLGRDGTYQHNFQSQGN